MIKVAIGLAVVAALLGWLLIKANEQRAVAMAANVALETQIGLQAVAHDEAMIGAERERQAYQAAMRLSAEWRADLLDQLIESKVNVEGATALMTDDEFWCASEPTPAIVVAGVRANAASRRH